MTLDASLRHCGFVQYLPDGSFRCHPLLRATARRLFSLGRGDRASKALRDAASWFAEHGDVAMGIRLGVAGGDWAWVARTSVQSWAVPRILLGTAGRIVDEAVQVPAVGEAEPVLLAAVAVAHRNVNSPLRPWHARQRAPPIVRRVPCPIGSASPSSVWRWLGSRVMRPPA